MMKIVRWLDKYFEESVMLVLLGTMLILMGLQVFMRYVLARSLSWPEEMIRFIFIWFVFIGMSYCVRENIHLRVDLLEIGVPRLKKALNVVQDLVFFAFCAYMIRPALAGIGMLMRNGQTSPAMDIPMSLVYASLLLGFVLTMLRFVQKWYRQLRAAFGRAPGQEANA